MAESITEGTLKQFSKRMSLIFFAIWLLKLTHCYTEVGDFVERDEEIATIETDKVRSRKLVFPLFFIKKNPKPRDRKTSGPKFTCR